MKYESDSDKDTNYFYICKSDLEITETFDHAMPWPTAHALRPTSLICYSKPVLSCVEALKLYNRFFFFTLLSTV